MVSTVWCYISFFKDIIIARPMLDLFQEIVMLIGYQDHVIGHRDKFDVLRKSRLSS